eukprot:TRINITY_DN5764_c0_g1_i3.p2 TRINITY_DN5764_c0_g1~~TRINITY_DN5764_c0_g1_i3.p2  ORF type:complete len:182 (+),score=5.48 TRINITY_DN5764_c0_g1_i3:56-547(+)
MWSQYWWTFLSWAPLGILLNSKVLSVAQVQGESMEPTLQNGDLVLFDKFAIWLCMRGADWHVLLGQLVYFRSPEDANRRLIKRMIGISGDIVMESNQLMGHRISQGHCWVEGDNYKRSLDSRTRFGAIPLALLEGRPFFILWPINRFGSLAPKHDEHRVIRTS